jgi:hypothetical protein
MLLMYVRVAGVLLMYVCARRCVLVWQACCQSRRMAGVLLMCIRVPVYVRVVGVLLMCIRVAVYVRRAGVLLMYACADVCTYGRRVADVRACASVCTYGRRVADVCTCGRGVVAPSDARMPSTSR